MYTWHRDKFVISIQKEFIDEEVVYKFLDQESYWAKGIARETVSKSIKNSLCFGVYNGDPALGEANMVGFAKVISDLATTAYLGDVFILKKYRGLGLGKWLISVIMEHPDLQNLRRFLLVTGDAHSLYTRFGFEPITEPERFMQKVKSSKG